MHGRPRKVPSQEEQEAAAVKAVKLRDLQNQVLHFHHSKIYTKEALDISAKLLEVNPEFYTGWNFRKLVVEHLLNQNAEANSDSASTLTILDEELRVAESALRKNVKSYGAWHHRKWVFSKGNASVDKELKLLGKFQKLDSRNFHAWNHRRYIATLKNISAEEELQYTANMIYDNFSNYSAWHNRSVLLSHLLKEKVEGFAHKENVLADEYDFVRNALFTDPDDQSGWFYHLWLLDQTVELEPVLVSSWPPQGSTLYVSEDGCFNGLNPSLSINFQSKRRMLPLILYFSEAVEGVSSSTIHVEWDYNGNDDVLWEPLSPDKFGHSHAWLTHLNFSDSQLHASKACSVKVSVAHSRGIISSRGLLCSQSSRISFTVSLSTHNPENAEALATQRISWKEENYFGFNSELQDKNLLDAVLPFGSDVKTRPRASDWSISTISNDITHCRELLSSTNCKIGKLTLARLLMAYNALLSYGISKEQILAHYEEVLGLYDDLMKLDPVHSSYYRDQYSLVFLERVTLNLEFLLKYSYLYKESTSPNISSYFCIRLSNLSLSRIGGIEQFLWVQMLDLSHNQLRSVEGLEAMQLLSCLNLSYNKLCSFTALEPLRLLKSLKVLNISYNEIGAHSVDTRRYLCSSPLSHRVGNEWKTEEITNKYVGLPDYWEAFSVFRELDLRQLDIVGNAVVDERFKSFLLKLLAALTWLDGEELH